jgi:hypothetical protein
MIEAGLPLRRFRPKHSIPQAGRRGSCAAAFQTSLCRRWVNIGKAQIEDNKSASPVAKYFKGEIIVGKDLMVVQRDEGETIMKLKLLLAVMTAVLGFASACPAQAQDLASQIVGVWKYVSVNNKEVATGKMTYPLGEKPNGYIVYTKGGRVIFTVVGDKRPQPAGSGATDAERVGLFNTLSAGSGTYKIEVTRVW